MLRPLALLDLVLLVSLLGASRLGPDAAVSVLGPLHGAGYVVLVGLVLYGATTRLWGWWVVALVALSGGAAGALVAERWLARRAT